MSALFIAINVIFAIVVVGTLVALHAHAIVVSRKEHAAPVKPARARTRPATGRPAPARRAATGRLGAVNG